ncbi:hypothetical protein STENM223S_05432 [Streptomyces tendae]
MEELALAGVPFGLPQDTFGVKMLVCVRASHTAPGTEEAELIIPPHPHLCQGQSASRDAGRTWPP